MAKDKSIEEVASVDEANTVTSENIGIINPIKAGDTVAKETYYTNENGDVVKKGSKEHKNSKQLFLLAKEGAAISAAMAAKYGFVDGKLGK